MFLKQSVIDANVFNIFVFLISNFYLQNAKLPNMKRYLNWNRTEQVCPAIASSPPPIANNPFNFALNGFNSGSQAGNSFTASETSNLLSAVAAVTRNSSIFSSSPIQLPNSNDNFINLNSNFSPENQFTTSAPPSNQPQLSAAAAEYLLAAAFASNTSQLACPATSLQQQQNQNNFNQTPTPRNNTNTFSQFQGLNQFNDQNSAAFQRQNATAALVAAIQQRQNQEEQRTNRELFAVAQSAIGGDNSGSPSIVGQLSSPSISTGGDSQLTNKLASVCAAALAASTGVTSCETNSATPSSTQNVCSSSQIILNAVTKPSIDQTCSSTSNPSSVAAAFLNQQHTSAFQLVPPPQQSAFSSFLQQQQLPKQTEQQQTLNNLQQAFENASSDQLALASSLSAGLPLAQQQAVPAGTTTAFSQQPQTQGVLQQQPSPMNQAAAAAAALYPQLMCLPAIFDRLGPHILRSHMSSTQFKPIPNNERVDLARFRNKEPQDWVMDDVLAWILDVARRNQIPVENLNMHKFATCNGPRLLLMSEQHFQDRDPVYGSMLFNEFRKLVSEDTILDDWMRTQYKDNEEESKPSTSRSNFDGTAQTLQQGQMQNNLNGLLSSNQSLIQTTLSQQHAVAAAAVAAAAQQFLQPSNSSMNSMQRNSQINAAHLLSAATKCPIGSVPSNYDSRVDQSFHGVSMKIKKNKDGRPRKRSQHTKGNKLWEFIRDALKDPSTCPSVVRWEDPIEGVFRIVESEKLARLWGEKKNNTKMTYEKLSRAMRTYYEKQILVPVPKTGLCPWMVCSSTIDCSFIAIGSAGKFRCFSMLSASLFLFPINYGQHWDRLIFPTLSSFLYNTCKYLKGYYYNTKILLPVSGRRLVYRFGPNSDNWRFSREQLENYISEGGGQSQALSSCFFENY
uniref:ETS domain-containing protein n=1 Tax=Panagrolaimus sp. JU765 TaxID=591449 RepID=A0AC34PUW9_9BILA